MLRRLLGEALTQSTDTVTQNVPRSPNAGRGGHTSTTSLFIMYMAIGFSVTFACILILMTAYHWIRRSLPSQRSRLTSRRNSSWSRQPQHEPKQMFVVQHPGGHANLAFREHEDPKPYKKKTSISVFSADLQESSFIIPAVRGNSGTKEPTSTSAVQPDNNDTTHARIMASEMSEHAECDCHEQEALGLAAAITSLPAVQRPVAHTASQTSPNKCMHEDNELQPCTL